MSSAPSTFLVTYDIADPGRLSSVYRLLRGYGEHLQKSVFLCALSPRQRVDLQSALRAIIHNRDDQVLFVDLGATDKAADVIHSLGRAYTTGGRRSVVI